MSPKVSWASLSKLLHRINLITQCLERDEIVALDDVRRREWHVVKCSDHGDVGEHDLVAIEPKLAGIIHERIQSHLTIALIHPPLENILLRFSAALAVG